MNSKPKKSEHSAWGVWYFSQSKVMRLKIIDLLEKEGIKPVTARKWMYRRTVPALKHLKTIEKITSQKAEILFPY